MSNRLAAIALAGAALALPLGAAAAEQNVAAAPATRIEPSTGLETKTAAPADRAPAARISDSFGVEVLGARLSASGYVIDLRYKVLDAEKARPLLDRKVRPVLVDEVTGNRFYVPQPPVVGALRQTARSNPVVPGKAYFMIFANPDQRLKAGDSVTLYLGEQRFGNLRIEP